MAARYADKDQLVEAARLARSNGYTRMEAYSPFPVEELFEILGHKDRRLPWAVFFGGLTGCLAGFFMQFYANVFDDKLNIGGRPFNSWPAFIPITFELTVLFAAITGFVTLLSRCGLPEIYHPVFNIPTFDRASLDSFFLCIMADDPKFNIEEVSEFLKKTNAADMNRVEH